MACAHTHPKTNLLPVVMIVVIFAVLIGWALTFVGKAGTVTEGLLVKDHAMIHTMSNAAVNCPVSGLGVILRNPSTGRSARICEFTPGQWAEVVEEDGECMHSQADACRPNRNTLEKVL